MSDEHLRLYGCVTCRNMVPEEEVDLSNGGLPRCRDCVAKGLVIQWPDVGTNSNSFKSLPLTDRFRLLSFGYLDSATSLCRELGEHADRLDWPRACVVYFCTHLAVELFLKACILLRSPSESALHHDISRLQSRYCDLYPDIKDRFHVETPWDIRPKDLGADIEDFESSPDQVFRYMTGRKLAGPKALHFFYPGSCLLFAERLRNEMNQVWAAVTVSARKERA